MRQYGQCPLFGADIARHGAASLAAVSIPTQRKRPPGIWPRTRRSAGVFLISLSSALSRFSSLAAARCACTSTPIAAAVLRDTPEADRFAGALSPDRDAAADGAVQDLRGALDPLGGGIERVGDGGLRRLGAIDRGDADIAQGHKLRLERADTLTGVLQLVAHGERRHHGEPGIADFAEAAAQLFDPGLEIFGGPQQPHLLPFLAGHAVLAAVDGDVDVVHSSSASTSSSSSASSCSAACSPAPSRMLASTITSPSIARTLPIAASSFSAISRLARSSLRDLTRLPSSSSASRERSAPSAWIRLASSSSSRSASRRRSTALSSASSAAISRLVATSTSGLGASAGPGVLAGRSFMTWIRKTFQRRGPRQNLPACKRLHGEAYVAGRACATSRRSYAPQSNF